MMSIKKKLRRYGQKKREQVQRGREVTEQKRAERLRKRQERQLNRKEGAVKVISDGVITRANPLDVMKQEYHRRKYEREKKYRSR